MADIDYKIANKDETDTHQAESASKHIKESGNNANGSYIKFDDGTMICDMVVQLTDVKCHQTLSHGGYRSAGYNIAYPAEFVGNVSVASGLSNLDLMGKVYSNSTTYCTFIAQTINSMSSSVNITVTVIAVGRWK